MYGNNYSYEFMTGNWNKVFKLNFLLIVIIRFLQHEIFSLRSFFRQEPNLYL